MTAVSLLVLLVFGGVVQAVAPSAAWLGEVRPPVLAALVVYYALSRDRAVVLWVAVLAGLVQDALGPVPLGTSSFGFGVAGLLVHRFRGEVFVWSGLTHAVMGALTAGGVTLATGVLLRATGQIALPAARILHKGTAALLLGAMTAPIVCRLAERQERMLGLLPEARP